MGGLFIASLWEVIDSIDSVDASLRNHAAVQIENGCSRLGFHPNASGYEKSATHVNDPSSPNHLAVKEPPQLSLEERLAPRGMGADCVLLSPSGGSDAFFSQFSALFGPIHFVLLSYLHDHPAGGDCYRDAG
jgi:hypothetical protein